MDGLAATMAQYPSVSHCVHSLSMLHPSLQSLRSLSSSFSHRRTHGGAESRCQSCSSLKPVAQRTSALCQTLSNDQAGLIKFHLGSLCQRIVIGKLLAFHVVDLCQRLDVQDGVNGTLAGCSVSTFCLLNHSYSSVLGSQLSSSSQSASCSISEWSKQTFASNALSLDQSGLSFL